MAKSSPGSDGGSETGPLDGRTVLAGGRFDVINLGQDGITSADALEKLPALLEANPQAVVVELGGHDFLKGYSRASTLANLRRIVDTSRDIQAEVILMEVPRGFITDPYGAPERELARLEDLELIADLTFWQCVPLPIAAVWPWPTHRRGGPICGRRGFPT